MPLEAEARRDIWTAVFAFKTASPTELIVKRLSENNSRHPVIARVRTACMLNKGVLHYGKSGGGRLRLYETGDSEGGDDFGIFFAAVLDGVHLIAKREHGPDLFQYLQLRVRVTEFDAPAET